MWGLDVIAWLFSKHVYVFNYLSALVECFQILECCQSETTLKTANDDSNQRVQNDSTYCKKWCEKNEGENPKYHYDPECNDQQDVDVSQN